jgi:hypothetical protein
MRMMDELDSALGPVLRDLARSVDFEPEIRDEAWLDQANSASAWLSPGDGSAVGVWIDLTQSPVERLVAMTDQVQEWVVEVLPGIGRPSNWPPCPVHPDSHPLNPVEKNGRAVWVCPTLRAEQFAIGSLIDGSGARGH